MNKCSGVQLALLVSRFCSENCRKMPFTGRNHHVTINHHHVATLPVRICHDVVAARDASEVFHSTHFPGTFQNMFANVSS